MSVATHNGGGDHYEIFALSLGRDTWYFLIIALIWSRNISNLNSFEFLSKNGSGGECVANVKVCLWCSHAGSCISAKMKSVWNLESDYKFYTFFYAYKFHIPKYLLIYIYSAI